MKYKKGDWVYIDYCGDRPPYPFKIVSANRNYINANYIINVHKPYGKITGWNGTGGGWSINEKMIIKKAGSRLELE